VEMLYSEGEPFLKLGLSALSGKNYSIKMQIIAGDLSGIFI